MNTIEFGQLIKLMRNQKDLTQEGLAEELGVTRSAVAKWEKGDHLPDIDMFNALAKALNVSHYDLHNPGEAIARLTNPPTEEKEKSSFPKRIAEKPLIQKIISTIKGKKWLVFGILFLLLFLTIQGICVHKYIEKTVGLNIRPFAYRETDDEIWGSICELALIYTGNIDDITPDSSYGLLLSASWDRETYLYPEHTILKVSFYKKEEHALEWRTPDKSFYLVRHLKEEDNS